MKKYRSLGMPPPEQEASEQKMRSASQQFLVDQRARRKAAQAKASKAQRVLLAQLQDGPRKVEDEDHKKRLKAIIAKYNAQCYSKRVTEKLNMENLLSNVPETKM